MNEASGWDPDSSDDTVMGNESTKPNQDILDIMEYEKYARNDIYRFLHEEGFRYEKRENSRVFGAYATFLILVFREIDPDRAYDFTVLHHRLNESQSEFLNSCITNHSHKFLKLCFVNLPIDFNVCDIFNGINIDSITDNLVDEYFKKYTLGDKSLNFMIKNFINLIKLNPSEDNILFHLNTMVVGVESDALFKLKCCLFKLVQFLNK